MTTVFLLGNAGIGTQDHQTAMYRPAFERHPAFEVTGDLDAAEAVSVAVPLADRAKVIGEALRAGRHVLADKPLAATADECAELARLAEEHGVVLLPALHQRFAAALRSARAAVRAGRVGLPWNVQCDFVVAGGDFAPGGELLNLGIYPVDTVRALLGLEVLRVHAVGAGPHTLLLDHEHGVTSTIVVGRTAALPDVLPAGLALHRYRISGSHGVLAVDATKPALRLRTTTGTGLAWTGPGTVDALLDAFAAGIRTGTAEPGPRDAERAQRVIEAAQRSLDTGQPVDLGKES